MATVLELPVRAWHCGCRTETGELCGDTIRRALFDYDGTDRLVALLVCGRGHVTPRGRLTVADAGELVYRLGIDFAVGPASGAGRKGGDP